MNHLRAITDPTPAPPLRSVPSFETVPLAVRLKRSPVANRIYTEAHTVGKRKPSPPPKVLDLVTKGIKTNWP